MSSSFRTLPFFLTLFLIACGGSGSDDTPIQPPANVNAPNAIADDTTTLNNSAVTIAVLANDSDDEGDTLSLTAITISPTQGTAELSGNSVIYTPNPDQINTDAFTYEVSDGEKTSSAVVTIENTQSITFAGTATDSPLANAGLSLMVNGIEFTTTTDAQGQYSIEVPLTSFDGNIIIKAQGTVDSAQPQATLFSFAGSVANAFSLAGESRELDETSMSSLNLNQLSTAAYLLALGNNETNISKDSVDFEQLFLKANSTDLLELAGFIKLIIDNENYSLSEGKTLNSFFNVEQNASPRELIKAYLNANNLLDEKNSPIEQYTDDLEHAISQTVIEFKQPFSESDLIDKEFVNIVGDLQSGYLPSGGKIYEFDQDGTGVFWYAINSFEYSYTFTWEILNGDIVITYDTAEDIGVSSFPYYSYQVVYRFGDEAIEKAADIAARTAFPSGQVFIVAQPKQDILQLVGSGNFGHLLYSSRIDQEVLTLTDGQTDEVFKYTFEIGANETEIMIPGSNSILAVSDDLTGSWILHHNYLFTPNYIAEEIDNHRAYLSADVVTLNSNGAATTEISGLTFSWLVDADNQLVLTNESNSITVKPIVSNDEGMFASITLRTDGIITKKSVKEIYKVEDTNNFEIASLQTILPEAYVTQLPATQRDGIQNGLLDIEFVFGYKFNDNNTVDRFRTVYLNYDYPPIEPYFLQDWQSRTIEKINSNYTFSEISGSAFLNRTWRVFKTNDNGKIWFLQSRFTARDEDNNGIFEKISTYGPPIINSIIKSDLSLYEDAWARTLERGIVKP